MAMRRGMPPSARARKRWARWRSAGRPLKCLQQKGAAPADQGWGCNAHNYTRSMSLIWSARPHQPPQVKRLVCRECGKACRSETEWDVHSKRTGHQEYDDKVGAGPGQWHSLQQPAQPRYLLGLHRPSRCCFAVGHVLAVLLCRPLFSPCKSAQHLSSFPSAPLAPCRRARRRPWTLRRR